MLAENFTCAPAKYPVSKKKKKIIFCKADGIIMENKNNGLRPVAKGMKVQTAEIIC
jgi:hypothetical protein